MKISAKQHADLANDELKDVSARSTGRSAPGLFNNETFDYNLAKFLRLTIYSGTEPGDCFATTHLLEEIKNG